MGRLTSAGFLRKPGAKQNLSADKTKLCEKCRIQRGVIPPEWDIANEGRPRGAS